MHTVPSRTRARRSIVAVSATALLLAPGCFSQTPGDLGSLLKKEVDQKKPAAGPLRAGVVGNSLGNSQEVSLPAETLLTRVAELQHNEKPAMAAAWVARHPETALEALRAAEAATPPDVYTLMAIAHDRGTRSAKRAAWTEAAELRRTDRESVDAYATMRKLFQNRISEGMTDRALELEIVAAAEKTGAVAYRIDARQLLGTALLLADRPQDAAAAFAEGAKLAAGVSTYETVYLLLLESDAERRAGQGDVASQTWQRAVFAAGRLILAQPGIFDPVLWERLSYLRPVDIAWPADVVASLATRDPLPGLAGPKMLAASASDAGADPNEAETIVWHAIGRWYVDRGQAQAALVAFKRAETSAASNETQQWLRFREARALAQLDQSGPAMALLVGLLGEKTSFVARPASALLGSIYIQRNQLPKGLDLLRRAVDEDDGLTWPERSEAEADLGLAYLTIGEAFKGLDRLQRAERKFEQEENRELLVVALENEEKFLNHTGKRKDAADIRDRLRAIEQRW